MLYLIALAEMHAKYCDRKFGMVQNNQLIQKDARIGKQV